MNTEVWKSIPGWPYEASSVGRIRNAAGHVLSPTVRSHGYHGVGLHGANGAFKRLYVHRLVLLAFVGPCPEGHEAAHYNDVPTDNRLENLRWSTRLDNVAERKHATRANGRARNQYTRRIAMTAAVLILTLMVRYGDTALYWLYLHTNLFS